MTNKMCQRIFVALAATFFFTCADLPAAEMAVLFDQSSPRAAFAVGEIQDALQARGHTARPSGLAEWDRAPGEIRIVLAVRTDAGAVDKLKSEGGAPPVAAMPES